MINSHVHLRHCNQGENINICKYGEHDTCPALRPVVLTYEEAVQNLREEIIKRSSIMESLILGEHFDLQLKNGVVIISQKKNTHKTL